MPDMLTAVQTIHHGNNDRVDVPVQQPPQMADDVTVNSPADLLQLLRSQPDPDRLLAALHHLHEDFLAHFNINTPGPLQAQIINTLVTSTLPTFWSALGKQDRSSILLCLRNVAGLSALLARLRLLSSNTPTTNLQEIKDLLLVLHSLLDDEQLVRKIWEGLYNTDLPPATRQMVWKEFIGSFASGKVVGIIACAEDSLRANDSSVKSSWLSNGDSYAAWLGRNVATLSMDDHASPGYAAAQMLTKAFSLGYSVSLAKSFFTVLVNVAVDSETRQACVTAMCQQMPDFGKRQMVESLLHWLSAISPSAQITVETLNMQQKAVSSISALIEMLLQSDSQLLQHLLRFITNPVLLSSASLPVRRSCIAAIASSYQDDLQDILEKLQTIFADRIFIHHASSLQQDAVAHTLLLVAGALHRCSPMAVLLTARSSHHMAGVSERLHASSQRARWLGMVVGTAVSTLVDNDGSRMNFGSEEMQTEEACGYLQLAKTHDEVEGIESFHQLVQSEPDASKLRKKQVLSAKLPIIDGKPAFGPVRPPVQTEVIGEKIFEVFEDDDEDVDELKPYAKPDDDPEDSDEDATLVKRNKPRAPVYIRDLMRMLKDDKDHDRFQLAIKTAPTLIRRKSSFGGEVRDHAEELALIFCDLQDPFDTEDFDELRLQSLIAVLLSDVDRIAPWLSRHTFAGEYSLSQRCIMMSALGLGGREIAGLSEQDATYNPSLLPGSAAFPSKRLPSRLHAVYEPTHSAVRNLENASKNVEHALIKPLALSAADQTTSHLNAVKVRTFSSRMEVERTKRKPAPNRLAKILGEAFFFPLVSRYQQDVAAYGQASVFTSAPIVLVTLVKTLALLLHASGPVTSNLPEITTAFWDLLLNLRVSAISDVSIMEAVLFSLLTLLEINSEDHAKQRLVQENPKHLAETQTWAELVFDRTGGGKLVVEGSGEEARVRTLAASVLVKTRDVIEAYQQQLMGGLHP